MINDKKLFVFLSIQLFCSFRFLFILHEIFCIKLNVNRLFSIFVHQLFSFAICNDICSKDKKNSVQNDARYEALLVLIWSFSLDFSQFETFFFISQFIWKWRRRKWKCLGKNVEPSILFHFFNFQMTLTQTRK